MGKAIDKVLILCYVNLQILISTKWLYESNKIQADKSVKKVPITHVTWGCLQGPQLTGNLRNFVSLEKLGNSRVARGIPHLMKFLNKPPNSFWGWHSRTPTMCRDLDLNVLSNNLYIDAMILFCSVTCQLEITWDVIKFSNNLSTSVKYIYIYIYIYK